MSHHTAQPLSTHGLESLYDALAQAIDQARDVGPDKDKLFLVKLALLNAQALGDERLLQEHIETALQDL